MRRILLVTAYDGTAYCGSQMQKNGPTIEGELHRALESLTGTDPVIISASRTDAGVHSLGNVFVFDTGMRMPADRFPFALNQRLPDDIVVQSAQEVAPDWHPRHQDSVKTYEYRILQAQFPDPLYRHTALFYHYPLDVNRMKQAASLFTGEHDFTSFCSSGSAVKTTVRTVFSCEVSEHPLSRDGQTRFLDMTAEPPEKKLILIRVSGSGFLYNMVRILAGTLIQVGAGERSPEELTDILAARDRSKAGPTAPAHGLTMLGIRYGTENIS